MTVEEAIKVLSNTPHEYGNYEPACIMAIEALEKQIPKKPTRANSWQPWKCECGNAVMDDSNYCKKCGTKLDWSKS